VGLGSAGYRNGASVRGGAIRLYLVAVGRLRRGPLHDLQTDYAGRLIPPATVIEVEEKRKLSPAELKAREAELILSARPAAAMLVALDAWRDRGAAAVAFAIGGAEGLGKPVLGKADAILSLGAMTWPHLLVRTMLLEQLYRAQQILAGHPYHRD